MSYVTVSQTSSSVNFSILCKFWRGIIELWELSVVSWAVHIQNSRFLLFPSPFGLPMLGNYVSWILVARVQYNSQYSVEAKYASSEPSCVFQDACDSSELSHVFQNACDGSEPLHTLSHYSNCHRTKKCDIVQDPTTLGDH